MSGWNEVRNWSQRQHMLFKIAQEMKLKPAKAPAPPTLRACSYLAGKVLFNEKHKSISQPNRNEKVDETQGVCTQKEAETVASTERGKNY